MAASLVKRCKDCVRDGVTGIRPAPHPGPRCVTHHREVSKARKKVAHDRYVGITYGLGPGNYDLLYKHQGGMCAGCHRAKGISKRLAVDHDHKTGAVRGLLCHNCNSTLAHFRDDPAGLRRLADYLENPPAKEINLGGTTGLPVQSEP